MKKIQCISCQEIIEKHDEEIVIKKRNEGLLLLLILDFGDFSVDCG